MTALKIVMLSHIIFLYIEYLNGNLIILKRLLIFYSQNFKLSLNGITMKFGGNIRKAKEGGNDWRNRVTIAM